MHAHWLEIFSKNTESSFLIPHSTIENAVSNATGSTETASQSLKNLKELLRRTIFKKTDPQHLENLYPNQKK